MVCCPNINLTGAGGWCTWAALPIVPRKTHGSSVAILTSQCKQLWYFHLIKF